MGNNIKRGWVCDLQAVGLVLLLFTVINMLGLLLRANPGTPFGKEIHILFAEFVLMFVAVRVFAGAITVITGHPRVIRRMFAQMDEQRETRHTATGIDLHPIGVNRILESKPSGYLEVCYDCPCGHRVSEHPDMSVDICNIFCIDSGECAKKRSMYDFERHCNSIREKQIRSGVKEVIEDGE